LAKVPSATRPTILPQ